MRSTSILVALAALAGMTAAKRGCRKDRANPGKGWYWIVQGDTLNEIAADFGTNAVDLAKDNGIPNPDSIPSWVTIVVPCPA
ncbi:peptidase m23b [Colletotrichum incanum]|uniref:Peptidase m23b n=1 Tax=Colletotrichum incanum TaxID=1573173 RepID=A0A167AWB8_COLIC|nr:peptidase m23b [Colletotrichum incanum]OHW95116.1 peptidase m23b [Colletotrichum incanum]